MLFRQGNRLINARNWVNLVRPNKINCESRPGDPIYGKFTYEPLERGYGVTIGNALRRVLLSSLQGAAFVSVHIDGVQHEFSTIPGVLEDVTDIILNIKQVRLSMTTDEPQHLTLDVTREGAVTAADISTNQNVKILNPDQLLATLTKNQQLSMEFEVRMGMGYAPADVHEGLSEEIGLIKLDSSFSPVRRVAYTVEQARVGQRTDYDKLILEVWTDGSILPEDAIAYSAKIIKEQISVFINFDEGVLNGSNGDGNNIADLNDNLFKRVDELELSVRAANCLRNANISYVGDLVQRPELEMLKTKNFGKKSLDEIRDLLTRMGLNFGMRIDGFDRKLQEWKRKQENNDEA